LVMYLWWQESKTRWHGNQEYSPTRTPGCVRHWNIPHDKKSRDQITTNRIVNKIFFQRVGFPDLNRWKKIWESTRVLAPDEPWLHYSLLWFRTC
jgi:hypothetical protein